MKKPNITEDWSFYDEGHRLAIRTTNWGVTMPADYISDAKAVSAVPEMINDLIVAVNYLEGSNLMEHQKDWLSKAKRTLKKAGVEL